MIKKLDVNNSGQKIQTKHLLLSNCEIINGYFFKKNMVVIIQSCVYFQTLKDEVLLKFNPNFQKSYNGKDFNVVFTFNRLVIILGFF